MCLQLSDGQQQLFNFILVYSLRWQLHKKFDESEPDPFYIFLGGGAGIAKWFLVNVITEYLKRTLKYRGGNLD